MPRPFRNPESYQAERITRDMLRDFLPRCGFEIFADERKAHGQTLVATAPSGEHMSIRVRLCWVRDSGTRDSARVRTYSAAQLTGNIKNDDPEGTLRDKAEREMSRGVTHSLFVQREDDHIVYAALVPLRELVPIWCAQRDLFDTLINAGQLGRTKRNPAINGSSPTLYLQNDRASSVEAALWNHPGVVDLVKMEHTERIRLPDDEAVRDESSDSGHYVPEGTDRRKIVERQIRERRGQQRFRDALRRRYGDRCMVTGCEVLAVLEAAHINPYRGESDNHEGNGLLLRADVHTLFDLNLIGIEPEEMRAELHPALLGFEEYGRLSGSTLHCEHDRRPALEALRVRYSQFQGILKEPKDGSGAGDGALTGPNEANPERTFDDQSIRKIIERFSDDERLQAFDAKEVNGSLPYAMSFMLSPRLERAAGNQLSGGAATISRYAIWAETIRGVVVDALRSLGSSPEDCETRLNLTRAANSLAAFATIQREIDRL